MRVIIYIIVFLILGICFTACRIKYIPVESIRTEYRTSDSIRHDSIFEKDSIYYMVKGDTILKYEYKYLYKYKYINKTDTMMKTDSIQVPVLIEKKLSKWQQMKLELGGWVFGIMLLIIGVMGYKKLK